MLPGVTLQYDNVSLFQILVGALRKSIHLAIIPSNRLSGAVGSSLVSVE